MLWCCGFKVLSWVECSLLRAFELFVACPFMLNPKAPRTHILGLLGPKTIPHKAFGLFRSLGSDAQLGSSQNIAKAIQAARLNFQKLLPRQIKSQAIEASHVCALRYLDLGLVGFEVKSSEAPCKAKAY